MKCPFCPCEDTRVLASRWISTKVKTLDPYYYRRRECPECKTRFTTREELFTPLIGNPRRAKCETPLTAQNIKVGVASASVVTTPLTPPTLDTADGE